MHLLHKEFLYTLRSSSRSPIFAAAFILAIAVGVGSAVSVFTVMDALLLRPLPVPHPEQLVELTGIYRTHSLTPLSYPMYAEMERDQRAFSQICGWSVGSDFYVEINGTGSLANVRSVTGSYYSVLGTRPLLGRLIKPSDMQSNSQVAVIGYQLWQKRFGGDASVVGRSIRIKDNLFTIIGVTPRWFTGFALGTPPQITVPIGAAGMYDRQSRSLLWLIATGRLHPGESLGHAQSQVQSFWPALLTATVPTQSADARRQSFLSMGVQLNSVARGAETIGDLRTQVQRPLYLLLGVVALILLIICVNLASLTLARASQRRHEISTRIALGASPWQAVRQFVAETLLLSTIGALFALVLSWWGSQFLVASLTRGQTVPILLDIRPDWRILAFAASAAIFTGLLTGLVPAWQLARRLPGSGLRQSGRTVGRDAGQASGKLGKALIVSQIAISLVLLQAAGLFLRSLGRLKSFDPGFDRSGVLELDLNTRPHGYDGVAIGAYRAQVAEAVAGLPSVQSVAYASSPILGGDQGWKDTVSSSLSKNASDAVTVARIAVSPGFFGTLGIPFVSGRDFATTDDEKHPQVVIIDSAIARQLFPSETAIGKHIRFGVQPDMQDLQIVGVAQPARLLDVRDAASRFLYVPALQAGENAEGMTLLVRGYGSPALAKAIEHKVESFGREYSTSTGTLQDRGENAFLYERMIATLSSFFAAIALLVAAFGLFGLLSYSVTLRTREIGVRMALGSQRNGILRLILREALVMTLFGIGIGIPCALLAARLFQHMLFTLSFADPVVIATAAITLLLASLAAGVLPALRAMNLDPISALRHE
jgi:predicted permease